MRRLVIIGLFIAALAGAALAPAAAQEGFTPEQQAALDEMRAAFTQFAALDTYTADVSQGIDQSMAMDYLGQTVNLVQSVKSEGTVTLEQAEGNEFANRQITLTQSISQQISGAGQDQQTTIGPIVFELIVLNDRVYMRMEMPPEQAGMTPQGWYDVTEGASMFPGMGMYNIKNLVSLGGSVLGSGEGTGTLGTGLLDALLNAVVDVEILDPQVVDEQTRHHYRLTLDPPRVLQEVGMDTLSSVFNASGLPFDLPKLIEMMFTDADTRYTVEVVVGADDQMIYGYVESMDIDLAIGGDVITDPSFKESTLTLAQSQTQGLKFRNFNEPVTIQVPQLAR